MCMTGRTDSAPHSNLQSDRQIYCEADMHYKSHALAHVTVSVLNIHRPRKIQAVLQRETKYAVHLHKWPFIF